MRRHAGTILTFLIGGALSLAVFFVLQNWEDERLTRGLKFDAVAQATILEQNITSMLETVGSIKAFYAGSREVERQEFARFTAIEMEDQTAIQALEWIPRVKASDRAAYEAAARRDGHAQFAFTARQSQGHMATAPDRKEYFPVYFVEPLKGNEAALGFDLASNPVRLKALGKARDTGELTTSGRITLVQETKDQYGFLAFQPIYRKDAPASTVEERRRNLLGFGLGVFRIGDVVAASSMRAGERRFPMDIFIFDRSAPADRRLLYPKSAGIQSRAQMRRPLCVDVPTRVGSRQWLITLCPAGEALFANAHRFGAAHWQSWSVLAAGLLFSALMAAYFRLLSRQTARVESDAADLRVSRREIRRVAEDLARLIDTANAPIFGTDKRGHITEWNQAAARILGYEKDKVLHCNFVNEFVADGFKAAVKDVLDKALEGDETANFELPLMTKDGKRVMILLNSTARRDATGNIIGVLGVGQDITERRLAQVQLIQASKLATLGEMATGMAHELNQPLNVIKMAADSSIERIGDGRFDAEYAHGKFARISAQVDRAAAIIDHMRIFGRRADEKMGEIDVREAVSGALGLVERQLRLRNIEVETTFAERCRKVLGHAVQLEQVVLNLVANARDAIEANRPSPETPGKITLIVEDTDPEERIRLIVRDTGGGIPCDALPRVFEPFFTTKETGKGTGLGLSISYGIITDMGGVIEAANSADGAEITITLPAADADPAGAKPG